MYLGLVEGLRGVQADSDLSQKQCVKCATSTARCIMYH